MTIFSWKHVFVRPKHQSAKVDPLFSDPVPKDSLAALIFLESCYQAAVHKLLDYGSVLDSVEATIAHEPILAQLPVLRQL